MRSIALPLARVEPGFDGIDHHGPERDLAVERVLAKSLVKVHRKMNRGLTEALTVFEPDELVSALHVKRANVAQTKRRPTE